MGMRKVMKLEEEYLANRGDQTGQEGWRPRREDEEIVIDLLKKMVNKCRGRSLKVHLGSIRDSDDTRMAGRVGFSFPLHGCNAGLDSSWRPIRRQDCGPCHNDNHDITAR